MFGVIPGRHILPYSAPFLAPLSFCVSVVLVFILLVFFVCAATTLKAAHGTVCLSPTP